MKYCTNLLTLALTLMPLSLSGQVQREPVVQRVTPTLSESFAHSPNLVFQQASQKSPAAAGLLSFLFPGVGSYYAGHASHGTRHLLIGVGSAGVFVLGVAKALEDCFIDLFNPCTAEEQAAADKWGVVALVGALAYTTNWVWSIVTATQDANAYNRAVGRAGMVSWLKPEIVVLKPAPTTYTLTVPRAGPRLGVQVTSISF